MIKALIIGSNRDSIVKAQCEPFTYSRKQLVQQLNLKVQYLPAETFADIAQVCKQHESEIVFLLPYWRENPLEAEQIMKSIREDHPHRKLILIDPFAQASTKYFNLLPYVDRFLKRQRYKNIEDYKQHYIGGSQFTDFVARKWNYNFEGWYVGSDVPSGYENRIQLGWSLGTAKRFKKALFQPQFNWFRPKKTLDIFCRLSLGSETKKEWYYEYRQAAVDALLPLASDYKIAASGGFMGSSLVPQRQYLQEIKSSRIVFSPFGWGESCWRDFEAICYNCLLVKPSMAHLDIHPNLFIEGETYVPVAWDFSDLTEKCQYYLDNPQEANRIIKNARQAYENYFKNHEFVNFIQKLIV